jgi:hypothetical protein
VGGTQTTNDPEEREEFGGYGPGYDPAADEAGELWCPECGAVMYADSELCPKCHQFVTPGTRSQGSMPRWIWVTGIVLLFLAVAGIVGALLLG